MQRDVRAAAGDVGTGLVAAATPRAVAGRQPRHAGRAGRAPPARRAARRPRCAAGAERLGAKRGDRGGGQRRRVGGDVWAQPGDGALVERQLIEVGFGAFRWAGDGRPRSVRPAPVEYRARGRARSRTRRALGRISAAAQIDVQRRFGGDDRPYRRQQHVLDPAAGWGLLARGKLLNRSVRLRGQVAQVRDDALELLEDRRQSLAQDEGISLAALRLGAEGEEALPSRRRIADWRRRQRRDPV